MGKAYSFSAKRRSPPKNVHNMMFMQSRRSGRGPDPEATNWGGTMDPDWDTDESPAYAQLHETAQSALREREGF
jgi:hypothetical protein